MAVTYGTYSSNAGGGKHEGQPSPKGTSKDSGSQLGSYGSKEGGGAWNSPGKSMKTMNAGVPKGGSYG